MNLSSAWLLVLGVPLLRASDSLGVKMTIQHGTAGNMNERTIYLQGDRKRVEFRNSLGHARPDGLLQQIYGPRLVAITRCDLGQYFELNLDTAEYTANPYPPKPLTEDEIKARGLTGRLTYVSDKPTLRIEETTTDTGERKEMFGHTARHVITTRKHIPLEGSHSQPQESVTDGWYIDSPDIDLQSIDLNQRLPCDRNLPKGKKAHTYSYLSIAGGNQPVDKPEFVTIGESETGFALLSTTTTKGTYLLPDGTKKQSDSKYETKVIQFEQGPLDPELFAIPAGFKQVEHIERNPPASAFANQPKDFWQRFKDTVTSFFSR